MNDLVKKTRIFELVHLVTLLAGGVSLLGSYFLPPGLREILSSLGTAFLASAFIGFFNKRYLTDEKPDLRKEWGLIKIYRYRSEKDKEMNSRISTTAELVEGIVLGGLHDLRDNRDAKLEKRLEHGLKMYLLVPKNSHDSKLEAAKKELEDWYHLLNKEQKGNITIRKYNAVPQEMYFRVDDLLVVGPYHANVDGRRNITYMFDANSKGGEIYINHFNDLWESSKAGEIP
jgi:hypothetical protein